MGTVSTTLCNCGRELAATEWICAECHARHEWAALIERRRIIVATIDNLIEQRETLTGQIDDIGRHIIRLQLNDN